VRALLEALLQPPWSPVALAQTPSEKRYVDLEGSPLTLGDVRIAMARLNHPQGVLAYRLERSGRSVVFATDCERGDPASDERLTRMARGVDVLIHDAQYTPEEYEQRYRGWGHSSWRHAVQAARAAGAGRLLLFHHNPGRSDEQIDAIVRRAREEFPRVEAAREGATLRL
jgi:ribonuclease BN (tRNA processing enzyme)